MRASKWRSWKGLPAILFVMLLVFAPGCGQNNDAVEEKGRTHSFKTEEEIEMIKKPPLDMRLPQDMATATFALG